MRQPPQMIALLFACLALTACHEETQAQATSARAGGMPPVSVGVITVHAQNLDISTDLPGRLEPWRVAQVRARVSGIVQRRFFTEGSRINADDVLFQIDPAPYQAALANAQASLAKAEANQLQARAETERYRALLKNKAISELDFINSQAASKQAEADIAAAKAAIDSARINLEYATVRAPISGVIGRALVTEGALVGTGEATELARIQQLDRLYVTFTQPMSDVLKLRRNQSQGNRESETSSAEEVKLVLEDGSEYPHQGHLLFTDQRVDAGTNQVTLRAQIPNPDGLLLPGMYVRVKLQQASYRDAFLVPQHAVTRTAQGDSLNIIDKQHLVAPRGVKVAMAYQNQWLITEGLSNGEQVMVDGFQKARPGATVIPVSATPPAPQAVRM